MFLVVGAPHWEFPREPRNIQKRISLGRIYMFSELKMNRADIWDNVLTFELFWFTQANIIAFFGETEEHWTLLNSSKLLLRVFKSYVQTFHFQNFLKAYLSAFRVSKLFCFMKSNILEFYFEKLRISANEYRKFLTSFQKLYQ